MPSTIGWTPKIMPISILDLAGLDVVKYRETESGYRVLATLTVMTFPGTPGHESHDRFPLPREGRGGS